MTNLRDEYAFFKANQEELVNKYNGKILVIKDKTVVATYDNLKEAHYKSINQYGPGNFFLQICASDDAHKFIDMYDYLDLIDDINILRQIIAEIMSDYTEHKGCSTCEAQYNLCTNVDCSKTLLEYYYYEALKKVNNKVEISGYIYQ